MPANFYFILLADPFFPLIHFSQSISKTVKSKKDLKPGTINLGSLQDSETELSIKSAPNKHTPEHKPCPRPPQRASRTGTARTDRTETCQAAGCSY